MQASGAVGANLLTRQGHADVLGERCIVERAVAQLAILAAAPAEDAAVMRQCTAMTITTSNLGDAKGPYSGHQHGSSSVAHIPMPCTHAISE